MKKDLIKFPTKELLQRFNLRNKLRSKIKGQMGVKWFQKHSKGSVPQNYLRVDLMILLRNKENSSMDDGRRIPRRP